MCLCIRSDEFVQMVKEQVEIQRDRERRDDRNLTWDDIQKMKYTWRVAQELMRIIPPVFGSFRKAVKDTSFGGFDIPKGWQVTYIFYTLERSRFYKTICKYTIKS